MIGKKIDFLQLLFPEAFGEILEKIARWNILGYFNFKKVKSSEIKPLKKTLSLKSKLGLSIPTKIASKMLRPGVHHVVPADVYQAIRKASVAFGSVMSSSKEPVKIEMSDIEKFYQEMSARITAVESIQRTGEDPRHKLDLKYIPKIISISLLAGFNTASTTEKEGKNVFRIRIKNCPMCKGIEGTEMMCQGLAGTLVGACSVTFKDKFSCKEIKCKAMGDNECVFILRIVS
jgi:predicted hydrocarbon binding protein